MKLGKNIPSAIVGLGLTGCLLARKWNEAVLVDKARKVGGRLSTGRFSSGEEFDFGATLFRSEDITETEGTVNPLKIKIAFKNFYSPLHYYPVTGMARLPEFILEEKKANLSQTLKKLEIISLSPRKYRLHFESSPDKQTSSIEVERLSLTFPVPQVLDLIQDSIFSSVNLSAPELESEKILWKEWRDFLSKFNLYRKTLVSSILWKNPSNSFYQWVTSIAKKSNLNKGADSEYTIWESWKYPHTRSTQKGIWLVTQYSSDFSDKYFETWSNPGNKIPSEATKENILICLENDLQSKGFDGPLPTPDELWVHRWKYAQNNTSLFPERTESILTEEPFRSDFLKYKDLCLRSNFFPMGDWLFGSRVEKINIGIKLLDFL